MNVKKPAEKMTILSKLNAIYGMSVQDPYIQEDAGRLERMRESLRKKLLVDKFLYCDTDSIKSESELVKLK